MIPRQSPSIRAVTAGSDRKSHGHTHFPLYVISILGSGETLTAGILMPSTILSHLFLYIPGPRLTNHVGPLRSRANQQLNAWLQWLDLLER